MTESVSESAVIESRVFAVTFVFNVAAGFFLALQYYLPLYLFQNERFSVEAFGIFRLFLNAFYYVVNPVLFLIVLYFVCSGNLFERIASTLISLITGSLLGYWIGGLVGFPIFASLYGAELTNLPLVALSAVQYLPYVPFGVMLSGFAILAFFDYNQRWHAALGVGGMSVERPLGVTVLAVLYFIVGIFDALFLPVLLVYPFLVSLFTSEFLVFMTLMVFFVVSVIGQILVGVGLLRGRKWGWIPAFISGISSLVVTLTSFVVALISPSLFSGLLGLLIIVSLFIGFVFSLVIVLYLLSFNVRRYFGMINPPSTSGGT